MAAPASRISGRPSTNWRACAARRISRLRAYHGELGIEGLIDSKWTWRVTGYTREERNVIRLLNTSYEVVAGSLIPTSFTTHYQNVLSGHSHGAEFTLERRSSSGLSG